MALSFKCIDRLQIMVRKLKRGQGCLKAKANPSCLGRGRVLADIVSASHSLSRLRASLCWARAGLPNFAPGCKGVEVNFIVLQEALSHLLDFEDVKVPLLTPE
jgi:hypothetical protein